MHRTPGYSKCHESRRSTEAPEPVGASYVGVVFEWRSMNADLKAERDGSTGQGRGLPSRRSSVA